MFVRSHLALLCFLLLAAPSIRANAPILQATSATSAITSSFDINDEGWRIIGDAQSGSALPTYLTVGGNPGGYLSAKDDQQGGIWYWQAPAKFLGDQSGVYQKNLGFDLKQSSVSSQFDADDVILSGNGITLVYNTPYNPTTKWTHYNVMLSESSGWQNKATNTPATPAEMQAVLQALTLIQIRGEYIDGADTGGLDNVILGGTLLQYNVALPLVVR